MKLKVVDSTDDKYLGQEIDIIDLNDLHHIFDELFDTISESGDDVYISNSNYTIKLKKF